MKYESSRAFKRSCFIFPLSSFILGSFVERRATHSRLVNHQLRRRSQVVRQRSAKPLFIGSIPIAASKNVDTKATNLKWIQRAVIPSRSVCVESRPSHGE